MKIGIWLHKMTSVGFDLTETVAASLQKKKKKYVYLFVCSFLILHLYLFSFSYRVCPSRICRLVASELSEKTNQKNCLFIYLSIYLLLFFIYTFSYSLLFYFFQNFKTLLILDPAPIKRVFMYPTIT